MREEKQMNCRELQARNTESFNTFTKEQQQELKTRGYRNIGWVDAKKSAKLMVEYKKELRLNNDKQSTWGKVENLLENAYLKTVTLKEIREELSIDSDKLEDFIAEWETQGLVQVLNTTPLRGISIQLLEGRQPLQHELLEELRILRIKLANTERELRKSQSENNSLKEENTYLRDCAKKDLETIRQQGIDNRRQANEITTLSGNVKVLQGLRGGDDRVDFFIAKCNGLEAANAKLEETKLAHQIDIIELKGNLEELQNTLEMRDSEVDVLDKELDQTKAELKEYKDVLADCNPEEAKILKGRYQKAHEWLADMIAG